MRLISFSIKDKERIGKEIKIDWKANAKRTDNRDSLIDGFHRYKALIGKNSSGKSTILWNMVTYFYVLDTIEFMENIELDAINQEEPNTPGGSSSPKSHISWSPNAGRNTTKGHWGKHLNISIQSSPQYIAEFLLDNGKVLKHQVNINFNGEKEIDNFDNAVKRSNISEKVWLDSKLIDSPDPFTRLGTVSSNMYKILASFNPSIDSNKDIINEFQSYTISTIRNMYWNDTNWESVIEENFMKWHKTNSQTKIESLNRFLKLFDDNADRFVVYTQTVPAQLRVRLIDGKTDTPLFRLSTGTRSALALMTRMLNLMDTGGFFIHDEIEDNLHLSNTITMIQEYRFIDRNVSKNFSGIFTTNFPEILDKDFRYDAIEILDSSLNEIKLFNPGLNQVRSDKVFSKFYYSFEPAEPNVWRSLESIDD